MNFGKMRHGFCKSGFTLVETLLVLTIIGVVAVLTIPTFIKGTMDRAKADKQANVIYKITQATDKMRALGTLNKFENTDAFVDEFQKHIKIIKRCDSNHIAECWPTATVTDIDGNVMEVASVKTGNQLNLSDAPGKADNNTVGIVLADGTSLIMVYDNTNEGLTDSDDLVSTSYVLPYGRDHKTYKAYTTNTTAGLSFVMDVNGESGPNMDYQTVDNNSIAYDIRSFGGAHFGTGCAGAVIEGKCYFAVESYGPITCSSTQNREYCNWNDSYQTGTSNLSYTSYHAGAKKACADQDMKMISLSELNMLVANNGALMKKVAPQDWVNIWADNATSATSTSQTTTTYTTTYTTTTSTVEDRTKCLEWGTTHVCSDEGFCYDDGYCKRYGTKTVTTQTPVQTPTTTTTYTRDTGSATASYNSGSSMSTHQSNVTEASMKVICVEN